VPVHLPLADPVQTYVVYPPLVPIPERQESVLFLIKRSSPKERSLKKMRRNPRMRRSLIRMEYSPLRDR